MSQFTDSRIMSGRAHLDGGEIDERDVGNEALNQVINPLILNDVIAAQELMMRARDDCMSRINEMNLPIVTRQQRTGHHGTQPLQKSHRHSNSPLPIQASFDEHLAQMIEQIQREITSVPYQHRRYVKLDHRDSHKICYVCVLGRAFHAAI